jgi:Uma2 family endonuclease
LEHLPPGGNLSFEDITWAEYEDLLLAVGEKSHSRISYDSGRLEIMSPSDWHDYYSRLLNHLVAVLTEEMGLDYISFGSTTFRLEKKSKGTEPDDCFYITHAAKIIGKDGLDIESDPPPDLAIEIDLWHQSLGKFPIYAAIGVPELWQYRKGKIHFYQLRDGAYVEIPASGLFPFLTSDILTSFLKEDYIQNFNVVKRAFRQWVRENKPAA